MPHYLLLNGPPESGKSTLAREAIREFTRKGFEIKPESFAWPMKQFISTLLGQPYSSIAKDAYHPLLKETPRDFLISLSENYIKPRYGTSIFGLGLRHRTATVSRPHIFVIDDSGFDEEFRTLPRSDVCLVRIYRPGHNYNADSRNYIPKPDRVIMNDGNLEKALSIVRDVVEYAIIKWRLRSEL